MNSVLTLEKPLQPSKINHPFLQELAKQIRLADTFRKYRQLSDELLIKQLIIAAESKKQETPKNLNLDPINQLLTNAFYNAIGATIENITGHTTETYVHLRSREYSSAVISCGGVLVLYSLIWGYKSFGFLSLQQLIETAETNVFNAVTKAGLYLDF